MADVLPPKRQTVVDRLRRRLELYRRHQGSCQPRYDQAANGIYDAQRHETLLLKQRFLEAKAKKTKRADNRHTANTPRDNNNMITNNNNNNGDVKSAIVPQSKLKRAAGSPLLDYGNENMGNDGHHPHKMPRNPTPDHLKSTGNQQQQQQHQQQTAGGMPSFSVQIVQQFTSSNTSQAPHSQTIQTNVTVQALSGGSIKTSNSPITAASPADNTNALRNAATGCNVAPPVVNGSGANGGGPQSTSISVGASIECKQEPNSNFAPCSVNNSSHANNNNNNNNNDVGSEPNGCEQSTLGDRFSDSLANLGFPEDSSDDVIHPDILKDIIDDVFTNPSDLMNGFSFVDNLKDTGIGDEKEPTPQRTLLPDTKNLVNSNPQQTQFHNNNNNTSSPSMNQFTLSQSQQSVFDFQTGNVMNNSSSQLTNVTASQGFGQARSAMAPPYASSNAIQSSVGTGTGNGLNLDFKLSEPSPAAQTLKQMAEQHQNMQQKQQQLGLGIGPSGHPRASFVSDSFPDPLTNIRSNFLSGSQASTMAQLAQKGPTNNTNNIFQSVSGFNQQQQQQQQQQQPQQQQQGGFVNSAVGTAVKQEVGSPVLPPGYANLNSQQISDSIELNKRRQQQALQLQQQQQQQQRPSFSHSPDQKNLGVNSGPPFPGAMPLSHYSDAMSRGSASNSPISHPGQFMRGVPTPGVTPPPTNFSSPSPSGATVHLSQSQQIQVSQNNNQQQLQVSQSQQQLLMSHDLKPSVTVQAQQQQQVQSRSFYPGHQQVHLSQSQSMNFQFNQQGNNNANNNQQQQHQQNLAQQRAAQQSPSPSNNPVNQQRHVPQYTSRPPPDYQSPVDQSNVISSHISPGIAIQQQQQHTTQRATENRPTRGRKSAAATAAALNNAHSYVQMDQTTSVQHQQQHAMMNNPIHNVQTTTTTGRGRGRGRGAVAKQNSTRHQRPPNVNVGPEGLNISQRPPVSTDWRHVYMSQQQQHQMNTANTPNIQVRIPYSRSNYVPQQQILSTAPSNNFVIDSNTGNHMQGSGMAPIMASRLANSMSGGGVMATSTSAPNGHILMQQHQQILIQQQQQQQHQQNAAKTQDHPQHHHHHQQQQQQQMMAVASSNPMPIRDSPSIPHSQQLYEIASKPTSMKQLDDVSQVSLSADNSDILDFLDNICSTSDLLNFDMGPGNAGSGFPLLDDMLGK